MSFKFYIGQTIATINLTIAGFDITGITDPLILYKKPNGVEGQVVPAVDGSVLTKNIADIITADDDGEWLFQASFVKGANTYFSEQKPTIIEVLEPLNP